MSKTEKPKPFEILASWKDVQAMMCDHTLIVVMALPTGSEGNFNVTYWSKENGEIPSWIIDKEAA